MKAATILHRPSLLIGSLIVLLFIGMAAFAPLIAPPENPLEPQLIPRQGKGLGPAPPSPGHPFGQLPEKYDVFYGLVWGTRAAMMIGLTVALGRAFVGILIGTISGYAGGWVDAVLMRIADAFMAFPLVAAVVVMLSVFGFERGRLPGGFVMLQPTRQEEVILLAFVLFGWVPYARLMRGNILVEREKTYIKAARSVGVPGWRMITRHLLPNSTYGLFALVSSDIGAVVVLLTAFTFIGVTTAAEMRADWGLMLGVARDWIIGPPDRAFEHWYMYMPVSAAIVLFSTGWALVGDGLRDALDPRLRNLSAWTRRREEQQAVETPTRSAPPEIPAAWQANRRASVPLDDPEAYAWLEYLAARQGASEALLLSPAERREHPPDWVLARGSRRPHDAPSAAGGNDGGSALAEARRLVREGDLGAALEIYEELVRSRQHLAEAVQDLSRAPQIPAVLQTLGDAHLRLGNVQQALEAYARAEKRLG